MTEREAFEDWYFKQNHLGIEPIDHARESYKAGSASRQAEIDAILSLIDKHQYSSGERILKEVKELLK